MRILLAAVSDQLTDILNIIRNINFADMVDIACVSVLLYFLYKFIKERRAGKLAIGVLLLFVVQVISRIFDMYVLQYILQNIFQIGVITLVILFQPEIRSVLEKVGATPLRGIKSIGETKDSAAITGMIEEVASAVCDFSETKTGALIVFERTTRLGDVIMTGTVVDAAPVSFLIKNIFFNKAPMHDGAMIIRNSRVHAAGCLLPLSNNPDIIKDLGTRHRAGIGMSENSDAVVVIVSEETGTISAALEGELTRGYDYDTLTAFLKHHLLGDESADKKKFNLITRVREITPMVHHDKNKTDPNGKESV
ncbi:MAG: diadenylate cyclase CdaA [Clostridia bacterium]|nr:diadenylate cyclase CdaA [Clostridia bacterium]